MTDFSHFSEENIQREIEYSSLRSDIIEWRPSKNHCYELIVPKTVYPPREDTDMIAKKIISRGPVSGLKFLEIGSGTGALSILACSMGWEVYCCDINPFAVAATKGNILANGFKASVKEGGIGPEKFPFSEKFDFIIWNLPYIREFSEGGLGPLEDASLIDNDNLGLDVRLVNSIISNHLLTNTGYVWILCNKLNVKQSYKLSHRIVGNLTFEDGECIALVNLWQSKHYENKLFLDKTKSTNDIMLSFDNNYKHIYSPKQTNGRGRHNRKWESINRSFAGSWDISEHKNVPPGLLQLAAAKAVLATINYPEISVKWPNDIMFKKRKLGGILIESISNSDSTKVVLGIGINLDSDEIQRDFTYSSLSEISDINIHELGLNLSKNLASIFEKRSNLPDFDFESLLPEMKSAIRDYGTPVFKDIEYPNFGLSKDGKLKIGSLEIDEIEEINWV